MNKKLVSKKEWLSYISFSNLVREIDEKFGHTYQDIPEEDTFVSWGVPIENYTSLGDFYNDT